MVCFDLWLLLTSDSLALHPPQTLNPNPKPILNFWYFLSKHRGLFERVPLLCWYNSKANRRLRHRESTGKTCNGASTPLDLWTPLLHDWVDMNAGYVVSLWSATFKSLSWTIFSSINILTGKPLYKTLKWYDFKNTWSTNAHKYFDRSWVLTIILQ